MQDYQLVQRNLGAETNPVTGVQSFSEFRAYLQEYYLNQGYEIFSIDLVAKIPADPNTGSQASYEYAYHLVKEFSEDKSKKVQAPKE